MDQKIIVNTVSRSAKEVFGTMLGLDIDWRQLHRKRLSGGESKSCRVGWVAVLGLSIPTVIFGRNFATRSVGQQAWRVFPLKAGSDEMELKFCLMPNRDLQKSNRAGRQLPIAVGNIEA